MTMNVDDKIREELERRDEALGDLGTAEHGVFGALYRVFTGSWRRWAAFAMLITVALFGVTVWSGYEFFTAEGLDDRVFWGVIVLAASSGVSALKLWFFLEMNLERDRNWTAREFKRLELALTRDPGATRD